MTLGSRKTTLKEENAERPRAVEPHTYNHSHREREVGVSGLQGYLQLQSMFKANLGYETLAQNTKKKQGGE